MLKHTQETKGKKKQPFLTNNTNTFEQLGLENKGKKNVKLNQNIPTNKEYLTKIGLGCVKTGTANAQTRLQI